MYERHSEGVKLKAFISVSLISITVLAGCSSKSTGCGADGVKASIIEASIKKYPAEVRKYLDATVEFAEEVKAEDEKAVRACAATINVRFSREIAEKYKKLTDQFSKFEFIALHGDAQILEDKVKASFTIKKNEADGGYFTFGTYESEGNWKLNPIVVKRAESLENIVKVGKQVESLSRLHQSMGKKEMTGVELKKASAENDLSIESCHDIFYIPSANELPSFGLFCRVSNSAGYFNAQSSRRLQEIGNFQELIVKSIRSNPRLNEGTKIDITDAAKIDEILAADGNFKSKSAVKTEQACKLAPEICTD
jgi:hypothetical protein